MAKRPSLGHQVHQALESKKCIGESRHEAKAEGTALKGIYSYKTYDAYKNASKQELTWVRYSRRRYKIMLCLKLSRELLGPRKALLP